jgi:hypothetical protein
MLKIVRAFGIIAIVLIALLFAASRLVEFRWRHEIAERGEEGFLGIDASTLNREIRGSLPTGGSRSVVERVLEEHHLEFKFNEHDRTIYSGAKYLKGSNIIVRTDLALQFHFDDSSNLTSIDSKEVYTGP